MKIGVPAEIKKDENRVSVPPNGVAELVKNGHTVFVQAGAGKGSGFSDEDYKAAGALMQPSAADTWNKAEMVIKVKEPQASEYGFLRPDLILFTYLHLAAAEELTHAMM